MVRLILCEIIMVKKNDSLYRNLMYAHAPKKTNW